MASIILPVALLMLSFFVKMSIEREVDLPKALQSFIELPTDIMFLSSSLVIAYILSNSQDVDHGLIWFIGCVVLSIFVVILWRKAEIQLSRKSWHALWISIVSYIIAIPTLVVSISVNIPVVTS
ncbi:hypothetical protein [Photobacterium phosphoreum]|uniref:hypothetical protein n=1 Tax=Photobacterium phosphoreum TaxID=659 RepID=UPI0011B29699|nr:hypothetical protein [Photobacterium phosphoreum]